jgi:hypothetical protein
VVKVNGTCRHALLYGMMVFMPVTGIAMAWYGGKGQPLVVGEIPGKGLVSPDDAEVAKHSFKYHKMVSFFCFQKSKCDSSRHEEFYVNLTCPVADMYVRKEILVGVGGF